MAVSKPPFSPSGKRGSFRDAVSGFLKKHHKPGGLKDGVPNHTVMQQGTPEFPAQKFLEIGIRISSFLWPESPKILKGSHWLSDLGEI